MEKENLLTSGRVSDQQIQYIQTKYYQEEIISTRVQIAKFYAEHHLATTRKQERKEKQLKTLTKLE